MKSKFNEIAEKMINESNTWRYAGDEARFDLSLRIVKNEVLKKLTMQENLENAWKLIYQWVKQDKLSPKDMGYLAEETIKFFRK